MARAAWQRPNPKNVMPTSNSHHKVLKLHESMMADLKSGKSKSKTRAVNTAKQILKRRGVAPIVQADAWFVQAKLHSEPHERHAMAKEALKVLNSVDAPPSNLSLHVLHQQHLLQFTELCNTTKKRVRVLNLERRALARRPAKLARQPPSNMDGHAQKSASDAVDNLPASLSRFRGSHDLGGEVRDLLTHQLTEEWTSEENSEADHIDDEPTSQVMLSFEDDYEDDLP